MPVGRGDLAGDMAGAVCLGRRFVSARSKLREPDRIRVTGDVAGMIGVRLLINLAERGGPFPCPPMS